jgi:hypothetical protein
VCELRKWDTRLAFRLCFEFADVAPFMSSRPARGEAEPTVSVAGNALALPLWLEQTTPKRDRQPT